MHGNFTKSQSKKFLIIRIICLCWTAGKLMSPKLWLASRLFPLVPPLKFLQVPGPVHLLLFISSLAILIAVFILPSKKYLILSLLIIEIATCLLDQNRWQPWEYQYIFMMLAIVSNFKNEKNQNSVIAFIIITVYFYSGLQKINPYFSAGTVSFFNRAFPNTFDHNGFIQKLLFHSGYVIGSIETLLALSLLFKKIQKPAKVLLIFMHLFIIVLFSPLGINYDLIIIPWNIAFLVLVYIIFLKKPVVQISFPELYKTRNRFFMLLFGVIPALNFFGYWDFFLSSSLFSYKPPEMYIYIHKTGSSKSLEPYYTYTKDIFSGGVIDTVINVRGWAFKEIGVPAYPEIRVYKKIQKDLTKDYPDMKATYVIRSYKNGSQVVTNLR
jgi:hypothetical protein